MDYKTRFNKALKDTFEHLNALSTEEFNALMEENMFSDRTNTLLYAWDYKQTPELSEIKRMEYMKSKKTEDAVIITVWDKGQTVCQCCKSHRNKPSRCIALTKSVGRKQDASSCESFGRKKR